MSLKIITPVPVSKLLIYCNGNEELSEKIIDELGSDVFNVLDYFNYVLRSMDHHYLALHFELIEANITSGFEVLRHAKSCYKALNYPECFQ